MLRDWIESEEDQDQNEIHRVEACLPACMKCRPLGCKKLREVISQVKKKEARSLLNSVLALLAISEEAKRLELTDEMREELCDTNPPLPSLLAVFTQEDAVEGCFDEEAQKSSARYHSWPTIKKAAVATETTILNRGGRTETGSLSEARGPPPGLTSICPLH